MIKPLTFVLFVPIHHRWYIHYYCYIGEDNGSRTTVTALKSSINRSPVKLIVIGVGNDVQTDVLKDIASSASKGTYCAASHYCIGVAMNYHQCHNALTYMVMIVISSICLSVQGSTSSRRRTRRASRKHSAK